MNANKPPQKWIARVRELELHKSYELLTGPDEAQLRSEGIFPSPAKARQHLAWQMQVVFGGEKVNLDYRFEAQIALQGKIPSH